MKRRKSKLYVEGGGDRDLDRACREAFAKLFRSAGIRRPPGVVPCGPRSLAFRRFCVALTRGDHDPWLLVDAESPIAEGVTPWRHVAAREEDKWTCPAHATDEHLHFMSVVMETWLVADPDALEKVFGAALDRGRLPKNPASLEGRPRDRVEDDLKRATAGTKSGPYGKGTHSFKVLAHVDPTKLDALPWARRFLDAMRGG